MVSEKLRAAIKLNKRRAYKIAFEAEMDPSALSKIMNGISRVKPGDPRVLKLGRVLGLPESQLFAEPDSKEPRSVGSNTR